jgi:hypothetical protein
MEENAGWPQAVYLETSILCQLPVDVASAELLRLKQVCDLLQIPIVIPKTALDEWKAIKKKDFIGKITSCENSLENVKNLMKKYLIGIQLPSFDSFISPKDKNGLFTAADNMMDSKLEEIGIVIAQTPNISLDLLLKMSIDKIRPFEEKREKGFRDCVILFTILEFAKNSIPDFPVLITADKVFDHVDVHKIASDHKIRLIIVNSIQGAIDELEKFIDQVIKDTDAKRAELLKAFLNSHKEEISEFISEQRSFSGLFGFKSEGGISPQDVKAISSVELLEIHNPTPGILPKGVKKDRVKISFLVKVKFSLIITQYYLNVLTQLFYGPEFEFRQETGAWMRKDEYGDFRPKEVPTIIDRDLKIEASALLDRDTDQYSEIQLERIA